LGKFVGPRNLPSHPPHSRFFLSAHPPRTNSILLFPRAVQTGKKASRLSGKVAPLVSSGAAPNLELPSLRTSTSKRYVTFFSHGRYQSAHCNCRPIAHVFLLQQFLPVSANLFRSIRSLIWTMFCSHLHSTPGPSKSRHPSWKPRSRRHDWRTSHGYGREMHSRSCWTCRGTFRHNLHSFLVDSGWCCDDRWVYPPHWFSFCFRIHTNTHRQANTGLLLPHQSGDFTVASVGLARV
jgi:hypothetical protein